MASAMNSLWSEAIRAPVQSPLSILAGQAAALKVQTSGVLVGEAKQRLDEDDGAMHLALDILVPALPSSRHRVLTIRHAPSMPYPSVVEAELFGRTVGDALRAAFEQQSGTMKKPTNRADTDAELVEMTAKVLRSPHVVSLAQSLIALVGELQADQGKEQVAEVA